MNKAALQRHADAMRDGITEALQKVRDRDGTCRLCSAPLGRQHYRTCPIFTALLARSAYGFEAEEGSPEPAAFFWSDGEAPQGETARRDDNACSRASKRGRK